MPSIQSPQSALRRPRSLPARFRRQRVLIIGCGDVGQRLARLWLGRTGAGEPGAQRLPLVRALTSSPDKRASLRALGITPLVGNLDDGRSLRRLAGLAPRVVHLAPPGAIADGSGAGSDPRTRQLLRALARGLRAPALVYGSTSGVYGDCQGQWVDETRPLRASTARALRRVDAETRLRQWGRQGVGRGARVHVLRIPGIYAGDREAGTPVARLQRGTPVLRQEDDVYTSHIHADDLARAIALALWRGKPQRVTNVSDSSAMHMGDYLDLAADLWQLPRPRRIARAEAEQVLSPLLMSFLSESRRLRNQRLLRELGLRLRYPTVHQGLAAALALS